MEKWKEGIRGVRGRVKGIMQSKGRSEGKEMISTAKRDIG